MRIRKANGHRSRRAINIKELNGETLKCTAAEDINPTSVEIESAVTAWRALEVTKRDAA